MLHTCMEDIAYDGAEDVVAPVHMRGKRVHADETAH